MKLIKNLNKQFLVLLALLLSVGAGDVWGIDVVASPSEGKTDAYSTWNSSSETYTWTANSDNTVTFVTVFNPNYTGQTSGVTDLSSYESIKFTMSSLTNGPLYCAITVIDDNNNKVDYVRDLWSASNQEKVLALTSFTNNGNSLTTDLLKKVFNIKFYGTTSSGSATIKNIHLYKAPDLQTDGSLILYPSNLTDYNNIMDDDGNITRSDDKVNTYQGFTFDFGELGFDLSKYNSIEVNTTNGNICDFLYLKYTDGTENYFSPTGTTINLTKKVKSLSFTAYSRVGTMKLNYIKFNATSGISEERTITVDGKTRKYWLYVPGSVSGKSNVPVVFSLHGRYNNDDPTGSDTGKPIFTELANENGFIVVYPQGRNGADGSDDRANFDGTWYYAFGGGTGWEATGEENPDTRFIEELVKYIKTNEFSSQNITVDPTRFYLAGFSMGGMMTYACARVLNGTFAAYGTCGGFPLNEYHMNLDTDQPIPFIHTHGSSDNMLGVKHLNPIIENLLARNGCTDISGISDFSSITDWTTTTTHGETHGFKRYDFAGYVPTSVIIYNGLWHSVESSAPYYIWDFFKDKTTSTYSSTTMEWQWDMTHINSYISSNSSATDVYGWVRDASAKTLTYGNESSDGTSCSVSGCTSASSDCDGNHNAYNSIQLGTGAHKLYATADVNTGSVTIHIYKVDGTEIVSRRLTNNSGNATKTMTMFFPFTITEDGQYYVKIERTDANSVCTSLAIHTGDYTLDVNDESEDITTLPDVTSGRCVFLDFEDVTESTLNAIGSYTIDTNVPTSGATLYSSSSAGRTLTDKTINFSDLIVKDAIFGQYYQNNPKCDIYDRSSSNYLRAVLPTGALSPIKTSGQATIGFWVNGKVAVDQALSYFDASMFYASTGEHEAVTPFDVSGHTEYQRMFNIHCNGNADGLLQSDDLKMRYYANGMFGDLCNNNSLGEYYKDNLYLDRNWHYITMEMYNNLHICDMYVDGKLTKSGVYQGTETTDIVSGVDKIKSLIIGGLNTAYTDFGYDCAFAFDDIAIWSRVLSQAEIQNIIDSKHYSANNWNFEKNLANKSMFDASKLSSSYWTNNNDGTYTLNRRLDSEAELTYDGSIAIPAFKGLKFTTGATNQITIDVTNGRLIVVGGGSGINTTTIKLTNAAIGQYARYNYYKNTWGWLDNWNNQDFDKGGDIALANDHIIGIAQITGTAADVVTDCTAAIHNTVSFCSIGTTDKIYADLAFYDNETTTKVSATVENPSDDDFPELKLKLNGGGYHGGYETLSNYTITYSSSAPYVAYYGTDNKVHTTGVAGTATIYAELTNSNIYDCDASDADLFTSKSRIIAKYNIHVPNADSKTSVKISALDKSGAYAVNDQLTTTDEGKAVVLTLGGWTRTSNSGPYKETKTDAYSAKTFWKGWPLTKTSNDANYIGVHSVYDTSESASYSDDNSATNLSYYTGGVYEAESEALTDESGSGLYDVKEQDKGIKNSTPWTLPCRGSHLKIEPTEVGVVTVYVLQEGCVSHSDGTNTDEAGTVYAVNEPYNIKTKRVYVTDEKGEILSDVVVDTDSKIASQVWKDDGRSRAEYSYYYESWSYNHGLKVSFLDEVADADRWNFLDDWPNPGMTQHILKSNKGYVVIDKGIVRYTFNVLPGKTYYIFSNDTKLGVAGFNFNINKKLNFSNGSVVANNPLTTAPEQTTVAFSDDTNIDNQLKSTSKNVKLTYTRQFTKDTWSSICLPYSMSNRQMKEQFGDNTMVVLMNKIYDATDGKTVQFIWHANQDIIAGYPYIIRPSKDVTAVTTCSAITESNPAFSVKEDGTTITNSEYGSTGYAFVGNFNNTEVPLGSYVIANTGKLARVTATGVQARPFRAYLYNTSSSLDAKPIQNSSYNSWNDDESATTSIDDVLFDNGILTNSADVYNINGMVIRKNTNNMHGLSKGIYIVNGKKYVVK